MTSSFSFSVYLYEVVEKFVSSFNVEFDKMSEFIMVEAYEPRERVYVKPKINVEDFTFVYDFFYNYFDIFISFLPSRELNAEDHEVKYFVNTNFTINKFMYLYLLKHYSKVSWVFYEWCSIWFFVHNL